MVCTNPKLRVASNKHSGTLPKTPKSETSNLLFGSAPLTALGEQAKRVSAAFQVELGALLLTTQTDTASTGAGSNLLEL